MDDSFSGSDISQSDCGEGESCRSTLAGGSHRKPTMRTEDESFVEKYLEQEINYSTTTMTSILLGIRK